MATAARVVGSRTGGARPPAALPAYLMFTGGGRVIPTGFFGMSVEYKELRVYERASALFDRVIGLIRPRDGGPMLLRVGGKSADHVWWKTATGRPPPWVTRIGDAWLARLNDLVRRGDLRLMLDLNLAVHSPALAVDFVKAVVRALPRGALAGAELGNEPDLYWRQPWLAKQRVPGTSRDVPIDWTVDYSALDYRRDYEDYARALASEVPAIPLGGPEIVSSKASWLSAITGLGPLDPSFIAIHRYAASTCWPASSPYYPTISMLLSSAATSGLAATVSGAAVFAHRDALALRLTEVNSVSCGGNAGVTDSFASALWTPDALFELLRAGVDGVNWHFRPATLNAPFHLDAHGIEPLPELYGLAVFARMTHGPADLLTTALSSSPGLNLKAWAVENRGAVNVLLINKGPRPAKVTLPAPTGTTGDAAVSALKAPRIDATTGVTFGGRWIANDGRWHGHTVTIDVSQLGGAYQVSVAGYSAVVVTMRRTRARTATIAASSPCQWAYRRRSHVACLRRGAGPAKLGPLMPVQASRAPAHRS